MSLNSENEADDYKAGESLIISGWGSTRADRKKRSTPAILQKATVKIISDSACKDQNMYGSQIAASMFCASGLGTDACHGCYKDWKWLILFANK